MISCSGEWGGELRRRRRGKETPYAISLEIPLDENSAKWIPDQVRGLEIIVSVPGACL